tara:strand:+ start:230 stop:433 length:204 start_codon:yes stop_codon:yes gene_type:complete
MNPDLLWLVPQTDSEMPTTMGALKYFMKYNTVGWNVYLFLLEGGLATAVWAVTLRWSLEANRIIDSP